jgi:hypothetical protein
VELGLLQVVVVVALPVGGGCVLPHSKNLASPEMTAVEERKDLLGLPTFREPCGAGSVRREAWGGTVRNTVRTWEAATCSSFV